MTSSCARAGLHYICLEYFDRQGCEALKQTAQGSGGILITGSVQKTYRYGT